jgi:hypothetical protein
MKTMIKFALAVATLAVTVPAQAEVYTYGCHRPDDFKLYVAKLDTTRKTITWNGIVYSNMKSVTEDADGSECAKACFQATTRTGTATLSTATQGVASLTVTFGKPGSEGVDEAEWDVLRK